MPVGTMFPTCRERGTREQSRELPALTKGKGVLHIYFPLPNSTHIIIKRPN